MTIDSSSEPAPDPSRDRGGWLRSPPAAARLGLLAIGLIGVVAASFGLGKYPISPVLVFKILASRVIPLHETWTGPMQTVVLDIRLPRIFGAIVVGATLASSGAAYQTVFRNPLVSPDILGVSAGAGFGAAIGITVGASAWGVLKASHSGRESSQLQRPMRSLVPSAAARRWCSCLAAS